MFGNDRSAWEAWKSFQSLVTPLKVVTRDLLASRLSVTRHHSWHCPSTFRKDNEFSECLSCFSNFIKENSDPCDTILIRADTNCSEKSSAQRKRLFEQCCAEHTLLKTGSSSFTLHHNNLTSEADIDMFWISSEMLDKIGQILLKYTLDKPLNLSCLLLLQYKVLCMRAPTVNTAE